MFWRPFLSQPLTTAPTMTMTVTVDQNAKAVTGMLEITTEIRIRQASVAATAING